jgi:hypothetical protein
MADFPTYEFEGDQIVAKHSGTVVANGTDFAKVAETAEEYFNTLRAEKAKKSRKQATHIITPNGMQAEILGRTASLWDDEITVRFQNGQIRHFNVSHGEGANLRYVAEVPVAENRVQDLQKKVDAIYTPHKEGLIARLNELEEIRHTAKTYILESQSAAEQDQLHKIALSADHEKLEVKEALEYLTSVDEAYEVPTRQYVAVEQASLGKSDSWLEVIANDMANESASQDFDKIMQEGPRLLVAALDDGAIQDASIVREIALGDVQAKTAGFVGSEVDDYRIQYVAATEVARQKEASGRKQNMAREASVKEASMENATDEGLFL